MAVVGLGALEPFIGAEEGVALLSVIGRYWSNTERDGIYNIESNKETKDSCCKYIIERTDDSKVYLKDQRGIYLSRVTRDNVDFIEAAKNPPDDCCNFDVFTKDGKVLFRADNGLFLSVIQRGDQFNIEAAKDGYDQYCEFTPTCGDVINPKFEIVSVDFQSPPEVVYKPAVVKEQVYRNNSSVEQKQKFNTGWSTTVTETTTWEHSWGLTASLSFSFLFVSAEVSVSYSGSRSNTTSTEKTITTGSETEVTVPPHTKVTARLVVFKEENASVPFVAKIKKTKSNGQVQMLTEKGTWQGVMYEKVDTDIQEEKI